MAIWSFCSSRWKPRHQSGHPSERANGLCPSTYRTHICTFPWQGLHGNTSGSWSTVEYTSLARLSPLGNLPRWPGGSKGLSSMFTWTVGLSAPPPLFRPELMPVWSCKCCSTYAGWSISASLICHPASNSISSACNSVCVLTSWHPCPNWGQNPEHAGSLEIAPSHHRQGSPQTFGLVDLYGHPSAERSALPLHNQVMGIRGLVSGDMVLVRQDFSHPDHSPRGGLVTLPCNAVGDLTEPVRDWDHSLYKCLQPQMGAQLGSHELQQTLSRQ